MNALVAALKRNDRVAITAEVLEVLGHSDRAAEARTATRATVAFFDRAFKGITDQEAAKVDEAKEAINAIVDEDIFTDIEKAIAKGKGKKALKLIKAAKKEGFGGSVLEALKTQAKGL